jgi:hypothetical protein
MQIYKLILIYQTFFKIFLSLHLQSQTFALISGPVGMFSVLKSLLLCLSSSECNIEQKLSYMNSSLVDVIFAPFGIA